MRQPAACIVLPRPPAHCQPVPSGRLSGVGRSSAL
jgi:hypothetical protein